MKTLLFLAVLALATLALRQYTSLEAVTKERDSLNEKISLVTEELDAVNAKASIRPTPASIRPPKPVAAERVICPVCNGEKVVVFDPSGSNNPLNRKTQNCPVCLGKGYRLITIPKGMKLCPDCKGMGLVYSPTQPGYAVSAGNCARCAAKGIVPDMTAQR